MAKHILSSHLINYVRHASPAEAMHAPRIGEVSSCLVHGGLPWAKFSDRNIHDFVFTNRVELPVLF